MRGVAEVKEPCNLPMLSVDMENKENGSVGVKNSVENGRPPDPADWAVMDVVNYFRTAGFEEQANAFQEQGWHHVSTTDTGRQKELKHLIQTSFIGGKECHLASATLKPEMNSQGAGDLQAWS
ncbi:sterile alpha motif domain-containing protein 13 isoform X1 [Sus scrofa]|uniref:sterile alpha motif domain-containing protein 13 isoform X1 n=1 Tax=Sus scrofa TaxID=9823 RepID=UPI000A2B088C|nr:sterile alpha motif domain-containing protein 13 isoform X1 [Sus scrofa]